MGNVLLGLLLGFGPQTIYSANKFFEAGISLFYSASLGAIRQSLQRLLADGWVTVHDEPENKRMKRVYTATPAGAEAFRAWMVGPILDRRLETVALSKLHFLGILEEKDDRVAALESVVDRARAEEAALAEITPVLARADAPDDMRAIVHYQRQTLEYGLRSYALGREFFEGLLQDERARL